jgi:hypothetical protein
VLPLFVHRTNDDGKSCFVFSPKKEKIHGSGENSVELMVRNKDPKTVYYGGHELPRHITSRRITSHHVRRHPTRVVVRCGGRTPTATKNTGPRSEILPLTGTGTWTPWAAGT